MYEIVWLANEQPAAWDEWEDRDQAIAAAQDALLYFDRAIVLTKGHSGGDAVVWDSRSFDASGAPLRLPSAPGPPASRSHSVRPA